MTRLHSYGSPSYYAQVMFSNHIGNEVPASTLSGAPELLFTSVTRDTSKRMLYLKVVNASSKRAVARNSADRER